VQASAILLTGRQPMRPNLGESAYFQSNGLGPASLPCVEIFGQSILERTIARLQKAGIQHVSVIAASGCVKFRETRNVKITLAEEAADRWASVQRILRKEAQRGIATIVIAELGAYAEVDVAAALQFHTTQGQPITPLHDNLGPLSYWIVDVAQLMLQSDFPLPLEEEDELINPPAPFFVEGYVNRLADPRDLRSLVVDAFLGRCSITPRGREIKPGVWVDEGARLHKTARLVAPVYIGCNARVAAGAVLTRCSNVERNSTVGEGTLAADASILPHTVIGRGLDVSGAVVDGSDFSHLDRNITLRIQDAKLIANALPRRLHVPAYLPGYVADRETREQELEYSQYLSRAAGRLLEVFKGEV